MVPESLPEELRAAARAADTDNEASLRWAAVFVRRGFQFISVRFDAL